MDIPRLMRIGKMNAFIGMFHDASLKRYSMIAKQIEETKEMDADAEKALSAAIEDFKASAVRSEERRVGKECRL